MRVRLRAADVHLFRARLRRPQKATRSCHVVFLSRGWRVSRCEVARWVFGLFCWLRFRRLVPDVRLWAVPVAAGSGVRRAGLESPLERWRRRWAANTVGSVVRQADSGRGGSGCGVAGRFGRPFPGWFSVASPLAGYMAKQLFLTMLFLENFWLVGTLPGPKSRRLACGPATDVAGSFFLRLPRGKNTQKRK